MSSLAILALVVTGCSSDRAGPEAESRTAGEIGSAPPTPTTDGAPTTSPVAPAAPSPVAPVVPAATRPTTVGPRQATPGFTSGDRPDTFAGDPTAPPPRAVGRYIFEQSGTSPNDFQSAPARGFLSVDKASFFQPAKRSYDDDGQSDEETWVFRPGGMYLVGLTHQIGPYRVQCAFGQGFPMPSWPPRVGQRFAGTGDCGQGQERLTIAGTVGARNRTTVPAGTFETFELRWTETTTISGTRIEISNVDLFAPELRVAVQSVRTYRGGGKSLAITSRLVRAPKG